MKSQANIEIVVFITAGLVVTGLVSYLMLNQEDQKEGTENVFSAAKDLFPGRKPVELLIPNSSDQVILTMFGQVKPKVIIRREPSEITFSIIKDSVQVKNCSLKVIDMHPAMKLNEATFIKDPVTGTDKYLNVYNSNMFGCMFFSDSYCCLSPGNYYDSKIEIKQKGTDKIYSDIKSNSIHVESIEFSLVYPSPVRKFTKVADGTTETLYPKIKHSGVIKQIYFSIMGKTSCRFSVSNPSLPYSSPESFIYDSSNNKVGLPITAKSNCSGVSGCCLTPGNYSTLGSAIFQDDTAIYNSGWYSIKITN